MRNTKISEKNQNGQSRVQEQYRPSLLSEKVFNELEAGILSNKIKPGESLVELKICAELGVSRTPVREAIRMLEQKGLARILPNRGTVVLGVDEKDLEDIFTIRMYIEGLSARRAAANISEDELAALTEIVELQEFYQQKNANIKINELDTDFHNRIYQYSCSRPLQHVLSELHHMILWFRELSLGFEGRAKKAVEEHRQILEALREHDGDLAECLMSQHVINANQNLIGIVSRSSLTE